MRAAVQGDATAGEILERNAVELADLVAAVSGRLGLREAEAALCGGLLEHETILRQNLVAHLKETHPALRCVPPKQSAAIGAAALARQLL